MERLDILVERIRRYTATQSYTDAAALGSQIGVQTQTIVDLFNEAQHSLHGIVYSNAPVLFVKTNTQNITADTESYTLPSDAFLGVNVISVEYKYGSDSGDYHKIPKRDLHQRNTSQSGTPEHYIQHNNSILLGPIPDTAVTNGLRITYEYLVPELDIRRGKVSAVDDGSNPTSITVTDNANATIAFGASAMPEYITVVDKDGSQQMKNIAVSAYDSGTGVITCSVTAEAGEAVAVDDYVVIGSNASTHSEFPGFCEAYLIEYVKHAILDMIGHPASITAAQRLQQQAVLVADVFSDYNADIMEIPEHDTHRIIDDIY